VPDEQSNLNLPASARRPAANTRRRGRRGGRGRSRSPRPAAEKAAAPGEISPASEPAEETAVHPETMENETDTSGGFREPHPEEPAEFAAPVEDSPLAAAEEPAAEIPPATPAPEPEPARAPAPPREFQRERRPERRPEPQRPKPWVKPADFRPAEASAISQAVEHATEIAESLKQMIDHLDEVLELVEVAERQKLADEREIDELRRALRRIQPPRREQQPFRPPRREEPPRGQPRESGPRPEEPRPPQEPEEPQGHGD